MYQWGILLNTSGFWYLEALEPSDLALPQVLGRGRARQQKVTPRKYLDKRQGGSFGNEFKFRDKSEEGTSSAILTVPLFRVVFYITVALCSLLSFKLSVTLLSSHFCYTLRPQ